MLLLPRLANVTFTTDQIFFTEKSVLSLALSRNLKFLTYFFGTKIKGVLGCLNYFGEFQMTFNFVTPENRSEFRELMQAYFERMALVWGAIALDDYDTQNASYVVCEHHDFGVIGGLRLLPTLGPKLSDDSLTEAGVSLYDDQTWEATKLFFYLPEDHPIQEEEEFDIMCTQFYTAIWEYLQEICPIEMIVTLLPECEHVDVKFFGEWPFILESTVKNPFGTEDGEEYILGVLKLDEQTNYAIAS